MKRSLFLLLSFALLVSVASAGAKSGETKKPITSEVHASNSFDVNIAFNFDMVMVDGIKLAEIQTHVPVPFADAVLSLSEETVGINRGPPWHRIYLAFIT